MGQDPDHRGAHVGVGIDADDDPADGANDALDGPGKGASRTKFGEVHPRYFTPYFSTW